MSFSDNNKRVAKNTLMLYIRMAVIILTNLFTTRVVLAELGVTDFGIYNIVGGIVVMFSFINNSMTVSTQRYLTYEIGRGDFERLNKVFSASLNIHIATALAIAVLAETAGLWFLNSMLNIPAQELSAANRVYQFSILTFCVNIIQVPYNAAIIAREKMNMFAYTSLFESALKLGAAYALTLVADDRLTVYAALVFAVQLVIRIVYQIYCRRHYPECRMRRVNDRPLYKEMSAFAGWNMMGSIAWLLKAQGVNILLNLFFGPLINAAQAVASQVRQAITDFVVNFMTAVKPQIIKYHAAGEREAMERLAYNGLKYSYMMLLFISLPLMLNVDYVLGLWLEDVPGYAGYFIVLMLVESLANTVFDQPLMISLAATGKIRNYQAAVSAVLLLIVPAGYLCLKLGAPPEAVYYVSVALTVVAGFVRFRFCRVQLGYRWGSYFRDVLRPVVLVTVVAVPVPLYLHAISRNDMNFALFAGNCAASALCVFLAVWRLGLSASNRRELISLIKKKVNITKSKGGR